MKSRELRVLVVLLTSQAVGLALIAAVVAIRGEPPPGGEFWVYGALSAVAGLGGLAAFYRGMAVGAMGVVAPISATAATIPVVVGIATGERPSAIQIAGIVVALAGVALVAREPRSEGEAARAAGVGLALIAAAGFGLFFLGIDKAGEDDVPWAILANRIAGVTLLAGLTAAMRPPFGLGRGDALPLIAIGALDMSANLTFAIASTAGLVSLVAVLGSLYPVTTVALARAVLGERIAAPQLAGAAVALAGVALISAG